MMNPPAAVAGAVNGIRVVESPHLCYDEVMVARDAPVILVGELAHFRYRLRALADNDRCRRAAREHIETRATEIFGEPWKVGGGV